MSNSPSTSSASTTEGPPKAMKKCSTNVELIKLTQEWSIANFSSLVRLCKPGQCFRSASFTHPSHPDVNWQLCMYPGGKRDENKGFISLFLKMYAPPARDVNITAEYRLFLITDSGEHRFANTNVGEFHSRAGKKGFGWGLRNLPRHKVVSCLRADGSLHIYCEVEMLPDLTKIGASENVRTAAAAGNPASLISDPVEVSTQYVSGFSSLYSEGILTDFTVVVGQRSFAVHRAILAAHSPVFRAMCDSEMTERSEAKIIIPDFSPDAVHQMLNFVYGGSAAQLETHVEELIQLAEKYELKDLKSQCEHVLSARISADTLCTTFAVADMYSAANLKTACLEHLRSTNNRTRVLDSDSYQQLKRRHPQLVNELLESLVKEEDGEVRSAKSARLEKKAVRKAATTSNGGDVAAPTPRGGDPSTP